MVEKAGAKDYKKYSKQILKVCKKPISFEFSVTSMKRQALIISFWEKKCLRENTCSWSQKVYLWED